MNHRSRLWLLLIPPLALAPRIAAAQTYYSGPVADKQSHRELPGGLDMNAGQEMMADRLKELHDLHQLQDQVQDLLKDPDFRERLRNQFTDDQLRQLREKILKGDGLSRDGNWDKLLDQASSGRKLDERQIDVLRRWAEQMDKRRANSPQGSSLLGNPSPVSPSTPSNSGASNFSATATLMGSPEPSFLDRLQEGAADWFSKHMDDLGGDLFGVLAEAGASDEGGPLADLLRAMKAPDSAGEGWADQAAGLSEHLSDVGDFLHEQRGAWDDVRSLFHDAPAPSLPSLDGPSLPSTSGASAADGESWGAGSLVLLGFGLFLLLLGKTIGKRGRESVRTKSEEWRLGPWPVSPDAVSTREELIRAFEYLALLCLGPSAGTHHHRDLAERLAQRDGDDPARSRQAADLLAWLYEQARYAPAGGSLSPDELTDARHALRFLAGVTTA